MTDSKVMTWVVSIVWSAVASCLQAAGKARISLDVEGA